MKHQTDEKLNLLRKYSISEAAMLGKGMEAEVYEYDPHTVLKLYTSKANIDDLQILKHFYDSLDYRNISYRIPGILKIIDEGSHIITFEKRIYGKNMSSILPNASTMEMSRLMNVYLRANLELKQVSMHQRFPGYKLFPDAHVGLPEPKDWNEFLLQSVQVKISETEHYFSRDVESFSDKMSQLKEALSEPYQGEYALIHGDFFPGNLLISDDGDITGLVDFGWNTMYGDPFFDTATGWVLFDMYDELKASLTDRYLCLVLDTLGESIKGKLYLYVLIYSVLTGLTYSDDGTDGHYAWCVRNLNNQVYWQELI